MARGRWLVLVGGGGAGRWQVGALDALDRAGLLSDLAGIVGTSVGGINACLLAAGLAQGRGAGVLKEAWAAITKDEDIYSPGLTAVFAHPWAHPLDIARACHGFVWGPAAVNVDGLVKLAHKHLDGYNTDQVESITGIKLRARAFNYTTGQAETLTGDLAGIALRTSAIEGVFPRQGGYGDGGAVDNCPVDVALGEGAQQVLVVYCGPESPLQGAPVTVKVDGDPKPSDSSGWRDVLAVLNDITAMNEALVDEAAGRAEAKGVQVVHCYPLKDTGSALDFSERGLLARGQAEAGTAIDQAKALGW